MRTVKHVWAILIAITLSLSTWAQETQFAGQVAVISIDTKGVQLDNLSMANLVRLELEKTRRYEVMDKYDVDNQVTKMNIDPAAAFGKSVLVEVGKRLKVDYILTGSVDVFGEKIIYILRLIDIKANEITKTSVKEYVNNETHIQLMTRISLKDMLGIDYDKDVAAKLENVPTPIVNENTRLRLNGPRFGLQAYTGRLAERMQAPKNEGGYNMRPFASVFGYQHEVQYLNSGKFQALFEFIGSLNAIESGNLAPSLVILNGVRYDGWEFGLGPAFRVTRLAKGYYEADGTWVLSDESPDPATEIITNLDSRGDANISTGLVIAFGKTFRSGHLNLPLNFYYSYEPTLGSDIFGVLLGFNIARNQ
jgi:hypothetical protein